MNETEKTSMSFGAFTFEFQRGEWGRMASLYRSFGLDVIQLSGDLLDELIEDPRLIPSRREDLATTGLRVAALGAYRNLVSIDLEKRQRNVAYVKGCLAQATALGAPVVSTETGTLHPTGDWSDTPENSTPAAWDALYAALDELLPAAEQARAVLALEGYVNNVLKTVDQAAALLERYPSPHLKLVCDPYNYLSKDLLPAAAQHTDTFLSRFEREFVVAHLKDVGPQGAEVNTPEFERGVFPQKSYLKFLMERRSDLPLILEHLPSGHISAVIDRLRIIQAGL
jgi:sugar phosphate isomerase/epimerase